MKRRRRVNWRLLLAVLAALAIFAGGAYALRKSQARRAVMAAKDQAFRAAERGDTDQAIRLIEGYAAVYRDDAGAIRDVAIILDRTGKHPGDRLKVMYALDRALQINPADVPTRRLVVRKALELRRWKDALDHLRVLASGSPDDAEVQRQLGECAEGQGHGEQALTHYARAIQLDPTQPEAYARRARLLRATPEKNAQADALMAGLRRAAPDSVPARLALGRYFRDAGRPAEAQADMERAVQLAPDSAEVRYQAALHALALNDLKAAGGHVAAGLAKDPEYLPLVKLRVEMDRRSGGAPGEDAKALVRRTLRQLDENPRRTADVLDLLINAEELALAHDVLAGPKNDWLPGYVRDFLEARLKIAEEDYVRGRDLLERCRAQLGPVPEFARTAHLLLGICQRRLGNADLAAQSCRTALEISPGWLPAQLELAAADIERGQPGMALELYRKLMPQLPEARLVVARLQLGAIMRRPAEGRDFGPVEELLKQAPPEQRSTAQWRLVRNDLLLAQGREREARAELEAALAGDPRQLAPRLALAVLLARSEPDKAARTLDAARRDLGDRVEIRLARANLALARPGPEAAEAVAKLSTDLERFSRLDQVRLLSGLYRVSAGLDLKLARQLAGRLAALQPTRIDLRFGMLRLALADGDEPGARELVAKLRDLEGDGGAYWRCGEAALRLQFSPANDTTWLADARARAGEAARTRPDWSLPPLLLGELDERAGDVDAALQRYRSAIELGERSPSLVRHTVQLLQSRRRFDEAQDLLRNLAEFINPDVELARLSLVSLIGRESSEQILSKARGLAPESSPDYRDHLWLGHVLSSLGDQTTQAEAAYRRAVKLKPAAGEAWVGLVSFLAANKHRDQAEAAAGAAEKNLKGADNVVPLAACYEAVGQIPKAERLLNEALAAHPADAALQRQLAGMYLRAGDATRAEPILVKLAGGTSAEAGWARRNRAMLLIRAGSPLALREAAALIEQNLREGGATPEDQRAKALLLALQPGRRAEAIRAMEQSLKVLPATNDEQVLLAKLYISDRNWPAARERLLAVATNNPAPRHLEYFVARLLDHDDAGGAAQWLDRLEKLDPDSWSTASLKARVLVKTAHEQEAKDLLRQRVIAADSQQILLAGRLLEEFGFLKEAEQAYLRFKMRQSETGPLAEWPLARFRAVQGKAEEALQACARIGDSAPPEVVSMLAAAIVRSPGVEPVQLRRLETWVESARKKAPESSTLAMAMADLREHDGRYGEAEALYGEVLAKEPANVAALNNFAVLLALRGNGTKALELTNKAVELAGPLAALLDTRGLARLAAGDPAAAVADFEEAIAQQDTPARRFHLAQAHQSAGHAEQAAEHIQKAKEKGVPESSLHPLERAKWREAGG